MNALSGISSRTVPQNISNQQPKTPQATLQGVIGYQGELLNQLRERLLELENKLAPILTPACPSPCAPESTVGATQNAQAVNQIDTHNHQINSLIDTTLVLTQRLQL